MAAASRSDRYVMSDKLQGSAPDPTSGGAVDLTAKLATLATFIDFISLLTDANRRRLLEARIESCIRLAPSPSGPWGLDQLPGRKWIGQGVLEPT